MSSNPEDDGVSLPTLREQIAADPEEKGGLVIREIQLPEHVIQDYKDKIELYEGVLRAIVGIKKVETPMDRSAEAFFMVASQMRKLALAALQKTGAML